MKAINQIKAFFLVTVLNNIQNYIDIQIFIDLQYKKWKNITVVDDF